MNASQAYARFSRQRLLIHPNNRQYLEQMFAPAAQGGSPFTAMIYGTEVTFSETAPERFTHEEWQPPTGDRFTAYGPEDEKWMKPLGLGTTRTVDDGPAFYLINEPEWSFRGPMFPSFQPILKCTA